MTEGLDVSRLQNDALAKLVQAYPEQFSALGTIPLYSRRPKPGCVNRPRRRWRGFDTVTRQLPLTDVRGLQETCGTRCGPRDD